MFDFLREFVETSGYLGIFLLMFAENLFPPIPSEAIMPIAGFNAADGKLSLAGVLISGTLGALAGAYFWYVIGRVFGYERLRWLVERYGFIFTVTPEELDRARALFERHARKAVFFGRLIPAIRSVISIPAGVAAMPQLSFLFWSLIGTVIWTCFLTFAGYILHAQFELVVGWVNPVSNAVAIAVVLLYLYRLVTGRGRTARKS
ncbi:alkaline phosphatase [Agaricicola taiwanensis]|uniref:Alkaline phosphatase n=1 Tax=Agaricicola taiwanensis TaxID=591372 RepID=A0A8J3DU58_9RHOB|nr:DedA family protein [Agaricicola taiwanensis]GGE42678.1 alkaline phosphatase [Agaricicola taiwanensis]